MTDVTIEKVQAELKQAQDNAKGLIFQLDAVKQMLNESIAKVLELQTNAFALRDAHHKECVDKSKLLDEKNKLQAELNDKNEKMSVMAAAIIEMQAKLATYEPPVAQAVLDCAEQPCEPPIIE